MTQAVPPPRARSPRTTARVAGVLYLLTFVSIPTLALYGSVLGDPAYVTSAGPDTPVLVGATLEVVVALACVGTAVVLHPVLERQDEALALGFVGSRLLEGSAIIAGVVSLLTVVSLRQSGAGAEALPTAHALTAAYGWFFLLGQSLMPVLNALLLGSLLYRSRLVPRIIPLVGLVGAPLLLLSDVAVLYGLWARVSTPAGLLALPIALWELALGLWLVIKGFTGSSSEPGRRSTVGDQGS